jgi:hypothetical protein
MRTALRVFLGLTLLGFLGCAGCGLGVVALYYDAQGWGPTVPPLPSLPVLPKPAPKPEPPRPKPWGAQPCPQFADLKGLGFGEFKTGGPELDGVSVATDMPFERFILRRNVGGSDGAGLCVYASSLNAADWVANRELWPAFWQWLQKRPGGSYPEKFARDIAAFCKEKGIAEPLYVQSTANDVAFLEEASDARVMLGVTYSGEDGVLYRQKISHMVNLVYFSRKTHRAAIVCNNFPDKILWMTDEEFLKRWSGWALAWLAPPPPPVPTLEAAP